MKVHVVACAVHGGRTVKAAIVGVFTDANLELAKSYTELVENDESPCYFDTVEVDDPGDIECLKEEIRERQGELADHDEAGPEVPVGSSQPESQGTTV